MARNAAIFALTLSAAAACAVATNPVDTRTARSSVFAPFVPPDVELFVEVRSIARLDDIVRRAQAWRLVPLSTTDSPRPPTLPLALAAMLNVPRQETLDAIVPCRAAFATRSWDRVEDSVVMIRLDDADVLNTWFGAADREHIATLDGVTRFLARGLEVACRDELVAIHHVGHGDDLFNEIFTRMRGRERNSLASDPDFRTLSGEVPAGLIGMMVLRPSPGQSLPALLSRLPGARVAMVALRELPGRIDIETRALPGQTTGKEALGSELASRMARLPEDTVLAWAGRMNWREAHALRPIGAEETAPWVALLDLWFEPEALRTHVLSALSTETIAVVGPAAGPGDAGPEFAVMVRLVDAGAGVEHMRTRLDAALVAPPPPQSDAAATGRSEHLGVAIAEIRLNEATYSTESGTIGFPGELRPAMAVMDGWLIVASQASYLRRLIDARRGLAPAIELQPEFRRQLWRLAHSQTFAFVQPAMAAACITAWQRDDHRLANFINAGASTPAGQRRLGIAVRVRNDPGVVVIEQVYPNGPAAGLLKPGDRIVGVDGTMLSLADTNAHLRRLLEASPAATGPRLRILRNAGFIEVQLRPQPQPVDAEAALRDFLQLCRQFEFAGLSTDESGGRLSTSRLSLRFKETAAD